MIIVGKDCVYNITICVAGNRKDIFLHVMSHNRCLQIAVIVNYHIHREGVNRAVIGNIIIIALNLNNLIGMYAGLGKLQIQRIKRKAFACVFSISNRYSCSLHISPLTVFIFLQFECKVRTRSHTGSIKILCTVEAYVNAYLIRCVSVGNNHGSILSCINSNNAISICGCA